MKEEEPHELKGHLSGNIMCRGMEMRNSVAHSVNKHLGMAGAQLRVNNVGQRGQRDVQGWNMELSHALLKLDMIL